MSGKSNAKNNNAALNEGRLASLVNSMADGVVALDEKLKIVMYNGAALNILDINSSIEGKPIGEVLRLIDENSQPVDANELVAHAKTMLTNRDFKLSYSDGSTINLYLSIAPVQLGFGKEGRGGYVLLLRDITREKSLEEERDEFISVISHELRTPVTIAEGNISNLLYLIEKSNAVPKPIKDALEQTHVQINYLAGLINDLATLSRADRGTLAVDIEGINTHQLVEELIANYTPQAEKKNLLLQANLDPRLELLKSSPLYVREILQNFITNAIKYTDKGKIIVGAETQPGGIRFVVSDTGAGISHQDQQKVFEKFFRSEDFHTRKNNGTGLGLYVTMKLANLIHAEINLKSELGKGSEFTIFVPNLK